MFFRCKIICSAIECKPELRIPFYRFIIRKECHGVIAIQDNTFIIYINKWLVARDCALAQPIKTTEVIISNSIFNENAVMFSAWIFE